MKASEELRAGMLELGDAMGSIVLLCGGAILG